MCAVRQTTLAMRATAPIGQGAMPAGCNAAEGFDKNARNTGNAIEDGARSATP